TEDLERFIGVEEDGDWAFIDELHGHHSLKDSGGYGNAEGTQRGVELFVEGDGFFRRGSGNEAGAPLATRVAIESELRDDKSAALDLQERTIHFALGVFEDTQVGDFFRHR